MEDIDFLVNRVESLEELVQELRDDNARIRLLCSEAMHLAGKPMSSRDSPALDLEEIYDKLVEVLFP